MRAPVRSTATLRGSSSNRERHYEHIKESAEQRGESTKRAKEIARGP
jgi:hypothetical protein